MFYQSAVGEKGLHRFREWGDLNFFVFGFIDNFTAVKIDFELVAFIDPVRIALDRKQA